MTQLSLFGEGTTAPSSSLVGLRLRLPSPCGACGSTIVTIGTSKGPHSAAIACGRCHKHRGWLSRAEFDRIAADVEISPGDLDEVVRRGLNASEELPLLLKALGIDKVKLDRTQPLVLRDMMRVCALCAQKTECDRDLVAGSAAEHYRSYCPNAPTIGEPSRKATPANAPAAPTSAIV